MSAGTITLTNGSATVAGSGTTFTTDLKVGDFVTATVGGTLYSLIVSAIASNTSLTLNLAYTGPTTGSLAWAAVPAQTLAAITAQIVVESTKALRGLNFDKANWQAIFSGTGNVTVTLPDLTSWTGPAWNSITTQLDSKAAKGANSDITSLAGLTTALSIAQGGTGATSVAGARQSLGLNTINGMTGGVVTGDITMEGNSVNIRSTTPSGGWPGFVNFMAGQGNNVTFARVYNQSSGQLTFAVDVNGTAKYTYMNIDGSMQVPGNITCTSLTQTSDKDKKENIVEITDALKNIDGLKGYTYNLKDGGKVSAGIIAQEWQKVLPSIVSEVNQEDVVYDEEGLPTGEVIKSSSLSVDYSGVCAFLLSALRELKIKNDTMTTELDEVKARLKAIDGLDDK